MASAPAASSGLESSAGPSGTIAAGHRRGRTPAMLSAPIRLTCCCRAACGLPRSRSSRPLPSERHPAEVIGTRLSTPSTSADSPNPVATSAARGTSPRPAASHRHSAAVTRLASGPPASTTASSKRVGSRPARGNAAANPPIPRTPPPLRSRQRPWLPRSRRSGPMPNATSCIPRAIAASPWPASCRIRFGHIARKNTPIASRPTPGSRFRPKYAAPPPTAAPPMKYTSISRPLRRARRLMPGAGGWAGSGPAVICC